MKPRPVATKQLTIKIFYFKEERKERKSKEGEKKKLLRGRKPEIL